MTKILTSYVAHVANGDTVTTTETCVEDAPALYAQIMCSREHLSNLVWAKDADLQSVIKHVQEARSKLFTVFVNRQVAGMVDLRYVNTVLGGEGIANQYNIGYWIGQRFARRGFMTQAVKNVLSSLDPGDAVYANVRRENYASRGVLQRCGFEFIGSDTGTHVDLRLVVNYDAS